MKTMDASMERHYRLHILPRRTKFSYTISTNFFIV